MKKITAIILSIVTVIVLFAGCGKKGAQTSSQTTAKDNTAGISVRVGGLKGPTTMGMVKLINDSENKKTENSYEFTIAASADELTPKMLKGEIDIVSVPINLASVLYNKSEGKTQMLAVNTLGVNYIVEKGGATIKSIADLKGKTLYATGKGSTPEYILNYILLKNEIDTEDVEIIWKNEPSEVVALMATEENAVAMLPQPFISVAESKIENLKIALDLTKEWESVDNSCDLITAVLLVRKEFAKNNPDELKAFLGEYRKSVLYINDNVEESSKLVEKYDIAKAAVASKAIPYCNIVCITGDEMKTSADNFLKILYEQNPASVGGKIPGEDFYLNYE